MVSIIKRIEENNKLIEQAEQTQIEKTKRFKNTKQANLMLGEALEGLIKDEEFAKKSLKEAEERQI